MAQHATGPPATSTHFVFGNPHELMVCLPFTGRIGFYDASKRVNPRITRLHGAFEALGHHFDLERSLRGPAL